jgi:hypothetical protein
MSKIRNNPYEGEFLRNLDLHPPNTATVETECFCTTLKVNIRDLQRVCTIGSLYTVAVAASFYTAVWYLFSTLSHYDFL